MADRRTLILQTLERNAYRLRSGLTAEEDPLDGARPMLQNVAAEIANTLGPTDAPLAGIRAGTHLRWLGVPGQPPNDLLLRVDSLSASGKANIALVGGVSEKTARALTDIRVADLAACLAAGWLVAVPDPDEEPRYVSLPPLSPEEAEVLYQALVQLEQQSRAEVREIARSLRTCVAEATETTRRTTQP